MSAWNRFWSMLALMAVWMLCVQGFILSFDPPARWQRAVCVLIGTVCMGLAVKVAYSRRRY